MLRNDNNSGGNKLVEIIEATSITIVITVKAAARQLTKLKR